MIDGLIIINKNKENITVFRVYHPALAAAIIITDDNTDIKLFSVYVSTLETP